VITDAKLRQAIDETLASRKDDAEEFLAYAITDFAVERTDLLYVRDQYHSQLLDFSTTGGLLPLGHQHGPTKVAIAEQMNHYGPVGAPGQYLQRWQVEYAKALSYSLDCSPLKCPTRVFYTPDESTALRMARSVADHVSGKTPLVLDLVVPSVGLVEDKTRVAQQVADARSKGHPIIVNESITGFGRTGAPWGQHTWDIVPDITVIGGAGGGGFPFGAVVAPVEYFTEDLFEFWGPRRQAGNPAIMAAGYATLKAIDAPLLEHVKESSGGFAAGLRELQEQFPNLIYGIDGVGLLGFMKFHNDGDAMQFVHACWDRGLMLTPTMTDVITLTPPLIASELELRRGIDLMASACLEWMH